MAMNDGREEKARLDRREFDLDTEEQERQRKDRDAQIAKVNPIILSLVTLHSLFNRHVRKPSIEISIV